MRVIKKFVLSTILLASFCSALCATSVFAESGKATKITIEIDYGDYDGFALPVGRTGKSYPVFSCVATDDTGEKAEDVRVTVKNPLGETITVNDGRFETSISGEYSIEYLAEKGVLSATETITVTVADGASDPYYEISENVPSRVTTGSVVILENGVYGGGTGDLNVEISLTESGENQLFEATGNGYYFVPEKSGEYVVAYTVTDFVNAVVTATKTITVEDSVYPVLEKPAVPATAVEGETLVLPLVDGALYRGGKYYLPVKVTFDESDVTASMTVENLTAGEHVITYSCENPADGTKKTEYSFTLAVNEKPDDDYEGLLFDKYFSFKNFESFGSKNGEYKIKAVSGAEVASFAFSRALPLGYLNFGLSAESGKANYSAAYLVLTDSERAADAVKIKIKRLASYDNLYLRYDDEDKTIKNFVDDTVLAEIKTYADGRAFGGFKSGAAYVSFEVEGIRGAVELSLTNVGSNNVTVDGQDYAPPLFLTNADFKSIFVSYTGRKVYLPEMKAFDLLDANPSVRIKVTAPDGSAVYSGEGGYVLEIAQSGTYRVEYVATDNNSNVTRKTATVYALDVESPVIKVSGVKSSVKVGEELVLPKAEITDNSTAAEDIVSYVYVIYGNNRKQLVGETYTFKEAGEYKIRYVAYDSNQNYSVTEFTVICR